MNHNREIQKIKVQARMRRVKENIKDSISVLYLSVNQNNDTYIVKNDEKVREMIQNMEEQ